MNNEEKLSLLKEEFNSKFIDILIILLVILVLVLGMCITLTCIIIYNIYF